MELGKLFGNQTAAKALLFLARYEEATAKEISDAFNISKTQVYHQLIKLEDSGFLSSRTMGNQRIYFLNQRLVIKRELKALLEKYIETQMPREENKDFYSIRRRPRSRGKPLGGANE